LTDEAIAERKLFARETKLMFGQVREDAAVDLYLISQISSLKRVMVIASGDRSLFCNFYETYRCRNSN
jgi:hypothetical protein